MSVGGKKKKKKTQLKTLTVPLDSMTVSQTGTQYHKTNLNPQYKMQELY